MLEKWVVVVPEYAGVKYRRIEKQGLQTPVWDDNHPGTPYLFAETFPSGKGKFHLLDYVPCGNAGRRISVHPHHRTPARTLARRHADAPFELDELYPEARIEINPADAARLKIEDGQPCGSRRAAAPSSCAPG